jgi:hypothetical protein
MTKAPILLLYKLDSGYVADSDQEPPRQEDQYGHLLTARFRFLFHVTDGRNTYSIVKRKREK